MHIRTKKCPTCGKEFSHEIGRGKDRKHCSSECRQKYQLELRAEKFKTWPLCSVEGCEKVANRKEAGLCETHYMRMRRRGTTDSYFNYKHFRPDGYVKIKINGHFMADKHGYVFEHRKVLYEALGNGPHSCFWCGEVLDWNDAVVDHLNEIKNDNRIENLVYSCNGCNRARGALLNFVGRMLPEKMETFIACVKDHNANYDKYLSRKDEMLEICKNNRNRVNKRGD